MSTAITVSVAGTEDNDGSNSCTDSRNSMSRLVPLVREDWSGSTTKAIVDGCNFAPFKALNYCHS